MTLYKQLVVSIIATFTLLVSGLFIVDFVQSRDFIEQKQYSEVKNALNTVGLAISPYLIEQDTVAIESVVNALFDGSAFSSVRVVMLGTGDEIVRSYPIQDHDVPQWLLNSEIFRPIHDKRTITSGWLQLAELEIISHPGSSYKALWESLKFTMLVSLIALGFALLLVTLFVKRSLMPLTFLSYAATKISNRDFDVELPQPKTTDLIPVFTAFNTMVMRIKRYFDEQTKQANELTKQAFIDPDSQLPNRRYFIARLDENLATACTCTVGIIKYTQATHAVQQGHFEQLKPMMQSIGKDIFNLTGDTKMIYARISDDEIAFIAPYYEHELVTKLCDHLRKAVNSSVANKDFDCGIVLTGTLDTPSEVLSALDGALTLALSEPSRIYLQSTENKPQRSKTLWLEVVNKAIESQQVITKFQLVKGIASDAYHKEVLSGISLDGEYITAFRFLNALEHFKQSAVYDRHIIESMIKALNSEVEPVAVAINLAQGTVIDPEFIAWLDEVLAVQPNLTPYLHFELPESVFIYHQKMTQLLVNVIKRHNATYGVDNFGHHLKSLDYLQFFSPDYVKLDYLFTRHLQDEEINKTLSSIAQLAHDVGAFVIATRVENKQEIKILSHHYINGLQGFAIDAKDSNE